MWMFDIEIHVIVILLQVQVINMDAHRPDMALAGT